METEEYVALGGLITIIASSLALVIKQIESSRCTDIDCCGVKCSCSTQATQRNKTLFFSQFNGFFSHFLVELKMRKESIEL